MMFMSYLSGETARILWWCGDRSVDVQVVVATCVRVCVCVCDTY